MPSAGLLAILDEMSTHIERAITAGFVPADEIGADVAELYSAEADPAVLAVAARRMAGEALREHLLEQAYWPDVTDCDRLDAAFSRLERAGIICRHNYACCGSCGAAEMRDLLDAQRRAGRECAAMRFTINRTPSARSRATDCCSTSARLPAARRQRWRSGEKWWLCWRNMACASSGTASGRAASASSSTGSAGEPSTRMIIRRLK